MPQYLSVTDVAELLGVKPATIRNYRCAGRLPEPDVIVGQSPGWKRTTIERWSKSRPGQGKGGGRPSK